MPHILFYIPAQDHLRSKHPSFNFPTFTPMKLLAKIFVATAFSFLLAHNLIPHHHHDHFEITQNHHDDDHHDHSIFSFGNLDDNFINAQHNFSINPNSVSLIFLLPDSYLTPQINFSKCKVDFAFVDESPPPDKHFPSSSHRGPPTV